MMGAYFFLLSAQCQIREPQGRPFWEGVGWTVQPRDSGFGLWAQCPEYQEGVRPKKVMVLILIKQATKK